MSALVEEPGQQQQAEHGDERARHDQDLVERGQDAAGRGRPRSRRRRRSRAGSRRPAGGRAERAGRRPTRWGGPAASVRRSRRASSGWAVGGGAVGSDRCDQSGRPELVLDEVVDAVRGELPPVPSADPLGDLGTGPPSVHFGHDQVQEPGQVDHLPVAALGQEVLAAQAGAGVRPEQPDAGREPDRLVAGRPPRRRGTAVTGHGPLVSQQPHPRSRRDRGPAGRRVPPVVHGGSVLDGRDPLTCPGDRVLLPGWPR